MPYSRYTGSKGVGYYMYINPQSKVLRHIDRLSDMQHGKPIIPVTIEIDLSNRCILGCQGCHFAHTHVKGIWTKRDRKKPEGYQDTGDIMDTNFAINVIHDIARTGVESVVWSGGGEPLTHPSWEYIIRKAKDLRLSQGMYTSGVLLTPDAGKILGEHMRWVVVSLDAHDKFNYNLYKNGDFEKACNGVRYLVGNKAVVGASFLLNTHNWIYMREMHKLAQSLGATYTLFRPEINVDPSQPYKSSEDLHWIEEAMPILYEMALYPDVEVDPKRFWEYRYWEGHTYEFCEGVQLSTVITPDGRVWICCQRRGVTPIGDMNEENLEMIIENHPRRYKVDKGCRLMCRLNPINKTLDRLSEPVEHEEFI
jgi:MoaA/NifB/PqqE/SkfB family radical SAM enzyme